MTLPSRCAEVLVQDQSQKVSVEGGIICTCVVVVVGSQFVYARWATTRVMQNLDTLYVFHRDLPEVPCVV